jgi:hypothetical protein
LTNQDANRLGLNLDRQPSLKGLGIVAVVFAVITVAGLGSYLATSSGQQRASTSGENNGVYHLMLVEAMNSPWNSTMSQAKFYVMGPNGLQSASNITIPVKTLIQLTIVSYDTPTPGSSDQMGVVTGTVGGNMYLVNGTNASMGGMPQQWGQNVSSVPGAALAHTFTVQELGINVPVVGGDTQIAYLYFNKTGTFTWMCLTPCGFGPNGAEGAMSATGWMSGQLTVK